MAALTELDLTACALADDGVAALAPALPSALRTLWLDCNDIGARGNRALLEALRPPPAAAGGAPAPPPPLQTLGLR
eukprot:COSAG01_NODE_6679_length_3547_cov_4.002320_1_plen_76_part_00